MFLYPLLLLVLGGCSKAPVVETESEGQQQQEVKEEVKTEEPVAEAKPAEAVSVSPDLKHETEGDAVTITGCDKKASGAFTIPDEGNDFHQLNSDSVGTSIIDTKGNLANEVVPKMLKAVNATITDPKKKFVRLRYPVDGSIARAAHERIGANSMILETTKKNQPISTRTRQHRLMVHVLLSHLGMVEKNSVHVLVPKKSKELKIAVYDAGGVGGTGPNSLDKVFAETKTHLRRVGAVDIRSSTLSQFDLVIFPGGSGSKQAAALRSDGRQIVKKFIEGGGGYVGICAGAYLAASNYEWSLGISNHKTFCKTINLPEIGPKSMWYRGPSAPVKMELTEEGKVILGSIKGSFEVRYHNGPIMSFMGKDELGPFRNLATFRSEVSKYKPQQGTMVNSPAIIAGEFGGLCLPVSQFWSLGNRFCLEFIA